MTTRKISGGPNVFANPAVIGCRDADQDRADGAGDERGDGGDDERGAGAPCWAIG